MTAQKKIEAHYSWKTRPVKLNCLCLIIFTLSRNITLALHANYSESEKFQNFGEQMSPVVCRGTILGRQESHQTSDLVSCLDSEVKNPKFSRRGVEERSPRVVLCESEYHNLHI